MEGERAQLGTTVPELEARGLVTRTFRRLDPERQHAVLDAILGEAAVKGPAAVGVKEVAHRAGVSVGSLYTYFGTRDGMLSFAAEICVRSLTGVLRDHAADLAAMPLRDALAAYVAGGIAWGRAAPGMTAFLARGAYQGDPEVLDRVVRPVAAAMRATVGQILAAAAARGEVRPDVDLGAVTGIVHALTIAVSDVQLLPYLDTYLQIQDGAGPTGRAVEAALELVLEGIGTRGRREP